MTSENQRFKLFAFNTLVDIHLINEKRNWKILRVLVEKNVRTISLKRRKDRKKNNEWMKWIKVGKKNSVSARIFIAIVNLLYFFFFTSVHYIGFQFLSNFFFFAKNSEMWKESCERVSTENIKWLVSKVTNVKPISIFFCSDESVCLKNLLHWVAYWWF